jgi:glucose uptake protein
MVVGIILALLAAVFWGSINVPILKVKESSIIITTFSTTISFLLSLVVYLLTLPIITLQTVYLGIISGIFWSLGAISLITGMKKIGMGKVVAIQASIQIILASIAGMIFFNEILGKGINNFFVAFLGIIFIILGIYTTSSIIEKKNDKSNKMGLLFALISGIMFTISILPIRIAESNPLAIIFPMTFGMCLTSWLFVIKVEKRIKTSLLTIKKSMLSGVIWLIGNYLDFFAIGMIGLAKGYSLGQLCVLIASLWSIFYFREFMKKKNIISLIISAVVIILGAALLAFAKT